MSSPIVLSKGKNTNFSPHPLSVRSLPHCPGGRLSLGWAGSEACPFAWSKHLFLSMGQKSPQADSSATPDPSLLKPPGGGDLGDHLSQSPVSNLASTKANCTDSDLSSSQSSPKGQLPQPQQPPTGWKAQLISHLLPGPQPARAPCSEPWLSPPFPLFCPEVPLGLVPPGASNAEHLGLSWPYRAYQPGQQGQGLCFMVSLPHSPSISSTCALPAPGCGKEA